MPILRFKQFRGKWEMKPLKELSIKIKEKNKYFKVKNVISNSATMGLISQNEYFDRDIANFKNINNYYIINKGDFVYNPRMSKKSPYGPINLYTDKEPGVISPLYLAFSTSNINIGFLKWYFKSNKWNKYIYSSGDSGARYDRLNISDSAFFNMQIAFPTPQEQNKIANLFQSIEKKIQLQQEKIDLLKEQKKGYMQKIFSRELRFKDENGKEFPEWETNKLSHYLFEHKIRNYDGIYSKEDVFSVSGEYGIINQIKFQGRSFAGKSVISYHVVHTGDIVYTKSPLKSNPYGIVKCNKKKTGIVSTLYAVYSCKKTLIGEFLDYYFQLDDHLNSYLRPLVNKGAKNDMKINNTNVLKDEITAPLINEQKKIIHFLSTFDKRIKLQKKIHENLIQQRNYFMQQMFI